MEGIWEGSKHNILAAISKGYESPSEIARNMKISLPYVLTQVKLLEAQGVLKKRQEVSKNPGKPKTLYSLGYDKVKIGIVRKDEVSTYYEENPLLKDYHQLLAHIKPERRAGFSQYYWTHVEEVQKVVGWAFIASTTDQIEITVLAEKENLNELREKIAHFKTTIKGQPLTVVCWVHSKEEFDKGLQSKDNYYMELARKITPIIDQKRWYKNIARKGNE